MTYNEALDYIHGLYWKGKKTGLEKTKELLELCGHPEKELKCIHIAGTNGKGSTAAMLASICKRAGYKVGLYTSPYIVRYNERVQVNNEEIPDDALCSLTEYLASLTEQMEVPPSEFEFGTVLAFLYFQQQNCDIVILETGLGGAFDSTNVISHPLLCIITALGFDHTAQLGNTMEEIAQAKAGIIKEGVPVIFYGENEAGEKVIREKCRELGTTLRMPVFERLVSEEIGTIGETKFGQRFSYGQWENIKLSLPGLYQTQNAAVVLEAIQELQKSGYPITEEQIRDGLAEVTWQARLECLIKRPLLLADGSHNPQGMKATIESLVRYFPERKLQFIFGAMADKELDTMVKMFLPLAKKVYVTAPDMPRAIKAEDLLQLCKKACENKVFPEFAVCEKASEALRLAKKEDPEEVIVLIGSLYLVGEAKSFLLRQENAPA